MPSTICVGDDGACLCRLCVGLRADAARKLDSAVTWYLGLLKSGSEWQVDNAWRSLTEPERAAVQARLNSTSPTKEKK